MSGDLCEFLHNVLNHATDNTTQVHTVKIGVGEILQRGKGEVFKDR